MPLHAIKITISDKDESTFVSNVLFELGALSVSTSELKQPGLPEDPIFHEPPQPGVPADSSPPVWQNSQITALYPLTIDIESMVMLIATHFDLASIPTFSMHTELFDEKTPEEWIKHVQKAMQPIQLGNLRISFPWHPLRPDLLDLRLDPGMAFGTGEHQTTQLCLQWLQKVVRPDTTLLDYGTGSGILAIAATMLAPNLTAVGVDIDDTIVRVACDNALRNEVNDRIAFCQSADEPQGRQYDVVVANILAGPLLALADTLAKRMKSGALIALAGLLVSQGPRLIEHYAARGVVLQDAEVKDGWLLLVGRKD